MIAPSLNSDISDHELINRSKSGDKKALEELINRYQDYIFNVALALVGDKEEAYDIMQEVLIKVITHIASFREESSFKTWLYRIVKNHFFNMKRGKYESVTTSFDEYGKGLDNIPDEELSPHYYEIEENLILQEAKISCMRGMLLCLDREQRLIFILGELFEFSDSIGSNILKISKENFRVKLHRAKQQLYTFLNNKCGLVNTQNPCRCKRKTAGFIKAGCVDAVNLQFQKDKIKSINAAVEAKINILDNEIKSEYQKLFQEIPFLKSKDQIEKITILLSSDIIKATFNI